MILYRNQIQNANHPLLSLANEYQGDENEMVVKWKIYTPSCCQSIQLSRCKKIDQMVLIPLQFTL